MLRSTLTLMLTSMMCLGLLTGCGSEDNSTNTTESQNKPQKTSTETPATPDVPEPAAISTVTKSELASASSLDLSYITDDFSSAVIIHPARLLSSSFVDGLEKAGVPVEQGMTDFIDQSGFDPRTIEQIILLADNSSADAAGMILPGILGFGRGPGGPDDFGPGGDFGDPPLNREIPKEGDRPVLPEQGSLDSSSQELQPVNFQPGLGEPPTGGEGPIGADGPGHEHPEMSEPPFPTAIIRFTADIDPDTFFDDKPLPPMEDGEQDGLKVKKISGPGVDGVVHFVNSKTVILTRPELLKKMVDAKTASSPLLKELRQVDSSNDLIVVADLMPMRPMLAQGSQLLGMFAPPMVAPLATLPVKTKGLTITAGLSNDTLLSLSFVTDSPDDARSANDLLTDLATQGREQYQVLKPNLIPAEAPLDEEAKALLMKMADELTAGITNTASGNRLTISIPKPSDLNALPEILKPAIAEAKKAADRTKQMNQLKQLGLAFHNYDAVYNGLPAAGSNHKGEKKGLSWRVHLLPYIEQAPLYNQFHLDEPWDSEHNKALISQMPEVFKTPEVTEDGKTAFHVIVGENTAFNMEKGLRFRDFTDGLSNTILAVQAGADKADVWTKPGGLTLDEENPANTFGTSLDGTLKLLIGDGSVRVLDLDTVSQETIKALITRNGGEIVGEF